MTPSKPALLAVAAYADLFSSPGFAPGMWRSASAGALPSYEYVDAVARFAKMTHEAEVLLDDFDWANWRDGARIESAARGVECADLDTTRRLLTLHLRAERFREGHLAAAILDGRVPRILRRLRVLALS